MKKKINFFEYICQIDICSLCFWLLGEDGVVEERRGLRGRGWLIAVIGREGRANSLCSARTPHHNILPMQLRHLHQVGQLAFINDLIRLRRFGWKGALPTHLS